MPRSSTALFEQYGPIYRWLVTIAGLAAFFTMVFSSTMVNVAIPDVMGAFGVGQDKAQYLSTAFIATTVTSLLLNNWFIAKVGQRPAFSLSLLLFCFGSVICGFGPTLDTIILGRVIQGFAAGIIQPMVMVVLFQVFPAEKRGMAMALFSMGVVIALGLGPAIGGVTIDTLSWRYIFFVPIPAALLSLLLGAFFIPDRPQAGPAGPFDFLGYAFMCAAVFCLMTVIGNGQRDGWASNEILTLTVILIVSFIGFVLSQRRPQGNLLDLSLFRNARFATAVSISFLFGFGSFATVYIFPVFGQIVQGYTATEAGSLLLPGSIAAAFILPITGRLADIFPAHTIIIAGLVIFAASTLMMADSDVDTVYWSIAFYLFIGRVGVALISPSLNSAALAALPAEQINRGAGAVNLCLMLGGSCGINTLVVVLERRVEFHSSAFTSTQTSANNATLEMLDSVRGLLNAGGVPDALLDSLALDYLGEVVNAQANTLGFQDGFIAMGFISLCSIVPVLLLRRKGRQPS
ncbi:MAG: DHA2 family efflux MFS transporter permease subunit [Alphaproteobacteria bacterium]|nr:DHA2 family efflux MFS transporter permease subunit [Alphaproteobacteria bacterium]